MWRKRGAWTFFFMIHDEVGGGGGGTEGVGRGEILMVVVFVVVEVKCKNTYQERKLREILKWERATNEKNNQVESVTWGCKNSSNREERRGMCEVLILKESIRKRYRVDWNRFGR